MVEPVYTIHHDRLAGSVGADNGIDLPFSDPETDTSQRTYPAKRHVDVLKF
jgi:hypothetical protein